MAYTHLEGSRLGWVDTGCTHTHCFYMRWGPKASVLIWACAYWSIFSSLLTTFFCFFVSTMSTSSTTPPPPAYVRRVDFPRLCQHYRPCREAGILECRSCHKYMCDLHINTRIYGDGAPSPAYIDRSFTAISVFASLHPYPSLSTYLSLALLRYI